MFQPAQRLLLPVCSRLPCSVSLMTAVQGLSESAWEVEVKDELAYFGKKKFLKFMHIKGLQKVSENCMFWEKKNPYSWVTGVLAPK